MVVEITSSAPNKQVFPVLNRIMFACNTGDLAIQKERASILKYSAIALCAQYCYFAAFYSNCLGYLVPFLNSPHGRAWMMTALVLQSVGIYLHAYIAPQKVGIRILAYTLSAIFCFLPAVILPIIGPAIICIVGTILIASPGGG